MMKRNNGFIEQEVLQNEFTAFITTSIRRERIAFLKGEARRARRTYEMEDEKFAFIPDPSDFVLELCETDALACALKALCKRERYVLFARVFEEKSFEEIADKLGLKYKGVTAIYHRTVKKLRNIIGGI